MKNETRPRIEREEKLQAIDRNYKNFVSFRTAGHWFILVRETGVYVCMYVSRSVLSLERPPGPRSLGKGREKKEFNRSRRWNKKNVKSTDTHRGGLEAPEESIW